MKNFLPLLLLLPLLLVGCTFSSSKSAAYRKVSTQEAVEMMAKETDYIIVDVRTPEEYASGHIPGAILVPNETIGKDEIPALPEKDQLLFVYCRSGNRSKQASGKLADLGYTNVVEFGGITGWTGDIVTD